MKPRTLMCATLVAVFSNIASACGNEPFLGEVCTFAFDYCPGGYVPADGRLLPISSNTALFSLLGTRFGGNGVSNFGVPDLRGRSVVGSGAGHSLTPSILGDSKGSETITITPTNLPVQFSQKAVTVKSEKGAETTTVVDLHPGVLQPIAIIPPRLTLTYCIAIQGIYPSRD